MSTKTPIIAKITAGIIIFIFLIFSTFSVFRMFSPNPTNSTADSYEVASSSELDKNNDTLQNMQSMNENNLVITDLQEGTGPEVENGNAVAVHYRGTLENGQPFDNSYDRGQPFTLVVGGGQVIQGWEKGLIGMKQGGKRKLVIPPEMGYGDREIPGVIPANSTLVFEIELVQILQ